MNTFHLCVDAAESAGLRLLLIGGHAVNARGYERTTMDVDFLVPVRDLTKWKTILAEAGFRLFRETKAFAQFEPNSPDAFPLDLMLVDDPTFEKLMQGAEFLHFADRKVAVAGALHLIALKLHATRTWDRAVQGKDYYDILGLIRANHVDVKSPAFTEILERYATHTVKERLLRDLSGLY